LKLGEKHAELVTAHDYMVKLANGMFSKEDTGKPAPKPGTAGVKDLAAGHQSAEAAAAAINAALSF
jgi:hypothetical protein